MHEEKDTQAYVRKAREPSIPCSLWIFCCYRLYELYGTVDRYEVLHGSQSYQACKRSWNRYEVEAHQKLR
jgi:hypothetical protein